MNQAIRDSEEESEISIQEIASKIKSTINYLKKQWIKLLIIALVGCFLGFGYAYKQPTTYTAKLSFVVEEGKTNPSSLASLAGQFGLDVGGVGSGGGLLYGENLLLFLKSVSLAKETLLTAYDSSKNFSLADQYAEVYGLRKQWAENKKIGVPVFFPVEPKQPYSRLQDSLIRTIVDRILKKEIFVERPEKKATFISVDIIMKDELLSKYYSERLVQKATDRYVQSKIKRQKTNVDRLQKRADSIGDVLNNKTYGNASDLEKTLDVNPGSRTVTVKAEVSSRDKMMLATIYGEVIKNLEIAKVQLSQETPTIQLVDNPDLPLIKSRSMLFLFTLIGGVAFVFFGTAYFLFKMLISK